MTTPPPAPRALAVRPGPRPRPPRARARGRSGARAWTLAGAAVACQMVTPLWPARGRDGLTVVTVVVFCAASVAAARAAHGPRAAVTLLVVAAGGGWAVEVAGLRTGVPFGSYAYTGGLGPRLAGVPAVVPLAWAMMAYPALVAGRTLAGSRRPGRRPPAWAVALAGGWALAAWDVFLDPLMVDAGHWRWADPEPALPGVPGVPLTNYAGWLAVAAVMIAVLDRALPAPPPGAPPQGPPTLLYLWTYASSVLACAAFFGRPGAALAGGLLMGVVAVPFAVRAGRRPPRGAPVPPRPGPADPPSPEPR